jgi:hypothetical protein
MQRKLLIVACLLAGSFSVFAQKTKSNAAKNALVAGGEQKNYKEIGSDLPSLRVYRSDGVFLTNETLKNDAPLIIMLFNPTCEHCEDETMLLRDNIALFKKTNLVLIAAAGMEPYLSYFFNNTKIADVPKIQVGTDSSGYIEKTFRYNSLPQINIYDKNRKLVEVFTGDTPLDALKPYIQ